MSSRLYIIKEQLEYHHHRCSEDNPVPGASGASHYYLCWHQPRGSHHDDLWKLSFKGVMLDLWVAVPAEMDVQRP